MDKRLRLTSGVIVGFLVAGSSASAQVIGTFRWQLAPYCNVVTLLVEQKGSVFELTGTDDQCGGLKRLPVNGTAHLNPDGSVTLGFGTTRLDGVHVATNATIAITTLAGSWSDDVNNSGSLTFNPPAPAGQMRGLRYSGTYSIGGLGTAGGVWGVGHVAFPHRLATAPTAVSANVIRTGMAPTVACPGSSANPLAAPGHLCLYEAHRENASGLLCMARATSGWSCDSADRTGVSLFMTSAAAGGFASTGSWALSVP